MSLTDDDELLKDMRKVDRNPMTEIPKSLSVVLRNSDRPWPASRMPICDGKTPDEERGSRKQEYVDRRSREATHSIPKFLD
jgi:hypothetical protein